MSYPVSRRTFVASLAVAAGASQLGPVTFAADDAATAAREQAVTKAIEYLRTKGQGADGAYTPATGPAVTALVTTALLRNGRSPQDPQVAKSLAYLEKFVQPDGGICQPESNYRNYETCLTMVCFSLANKDGKYTEILKKSDKYIKGEQWDESEGQEPSSPSYGGAGYGKSKRPDLSNTSFLMDALKAAGAGPDDPAMKKALIFVSRCQNLEHEFNQTEFANKNPDGGFYYTPAAGGSSMAGKTDGGGLRSYASMTYAGLKSMIYAGLDAKDPRVKAAIEWLRMNYAVDSNPGLGDAGLYYYYLTFSKALDAFGQETFTDKAGKAHAWRDELSAELVKRQRTDGSWTNDNSRWMEGDANLVTAYALMSLSYCVAPKK